MRFHLIPLPPIFIPTLSLIAGICCYAFQAGFIVQYACILFLSLVCFSVTKNTIAFDRRLLPVIFSVLSFFWGMLHPAIKARRHRTFLTSMSGNIVNITGTVRDYETREEAGKTSRSPQMLLIKPYIIETNNRQILSPHCGLIKLYLRQRITCGIGDTVRLEKIFWRVRDDAQNERYFLCAGLAGIFSVDSENTIVLKKGCGPTASLGNFFCEKRARLSKELSSKMSAESFTLFNTLFLGKSINTGEHLDKAKQDFSAWGIAHHLARSGLHVTAVLMLWQLLFGLFPLGFFIRQLLLLIGLGCFWLFSWPSVSFLRAIFTYLVAQTSILARIQPHPFHIVTLVCFAVLAYNPFHLFFLNFQLSFLLAFILVFFREIILARRRNLPESSKQ